jgi:hypothetical protein
MIPSHVVSRAVRVVMSGGSLRAGRPGERGAVLVHVAVAMTGLLAFSAMSIDLGTLWVARGETQNAADAAALSGAVSMLGVDMSTEDGRTAVREAAEAVATRHRIWGEPVDLARSVQVTSGSGVCPGVAGECVNVVISRGPDVGAPLPVFFSRVFGAGSNSVKAYASARASAGNATGCPAPLAVPDLWIDRMTNPIDSDADHGPTNPVFDIGVDQYVGPGPSDVGTGYIRSSIGATFEWRRFPNLTQADMLGRLEFAPLDLSPDGSGSVDVFVAGLFACTGVHLSIGDRVPTFQVGGDDIRLPLAELYLRDQGARWNGTQIVSDFAVTPRLLTVAVFDPEDYVRQRLSGVRYPTVTIRNFIGIFVLAQTEHPLPGVLVPTSGSFDGGAETIDARAAFLRSIALVR